MVIATKIQLVMADMDIVSRAAILMGTGHVVTRTHQVKRFKPQYRFSLDCEKAAQWMRRLYPILGVRRQKQIDVALAGSNKAYK